MDPASVPAKEKGIPTRRWTPGDILQLSGKYWETCALHAGVKTGVFTHIGDEAVTAEEAASQMDGASIDGTERLLNALTAMGLLQKRNGRYTCLPSVREMLSQKSPAYLGHIIMHHHHLMESWARLDLSVVSGQPIRPRLSFDHEEWRASFLMGMFNLAMALAPRIAAAVDLSSRSCLLDLGGGPGTYAIHFCQKNPNLKATVFDLPSSRPFAEKTIGRFGLSDRIAFAEGNYLTDDIPGGYDVAWLSHILHAESADDCLSIIRKTASALKPGGLLLIHEFILNDTQDGPLFPALFSLNMLQGTKSGRAYSESQLRKMMTISGVRDVCRIPIQTPNDSGILTGTV
jgi:SAM-dependent methyltransferase